MRPERLPAQKACALLGVSRNLLYREPVDRSDVIETARDLIGRIETIVLAFPGYGYRRVTAHLQRDGIIINHKRVLSVMRKESLLCKNAKRWTKTTDSEHGLRVYPNLIKDLEITGLNQVFQADITYVRLPKGFCYAAAVLDACSRRVVGFAVSLDIDAKLVLEALNMALTDRRPQSGFIHHSDRGVQYACREYVNRLQEAGARISMSAKGAPRENAKAESFFKTLKAEEVYLQEYQSFDEARREITRFIEDVYNQKRLHSALGYCPPVEFESQLETNHAAECVS